MATPRVFVSSTCYDLKYIRENLKYFIRTLGYEPVLSEDGAVFFDPTLHTHDACLAEVPNCQIFVLIIGGRFGGRYRAGNHSITNAEYREAVRLQIPIFALVENAVYNEHHLYLRNQNNSDIDRKKIAYPSADSTCIFEFIDEVRTSITNNAVVPFRDFGDIEAYLRQQWAAMMFDFITRRSEAKRVADTLSALADMNSRIEMISKQILRSVGTDAAKIDAVLYEEMIAAESIRDMGYWGLRPSPTSILLNASFRTCVKSLGAELDVRSELEGIVLGPSCYMSRKKFEQSSHDYKRVRQRLVDLLKEHGLTAEAYVKNEVPQGSPLPEIAPAPFS